VESGKFKKMSQKELSTKFRECLTSLIDFNEQWHSHSKEWDRGAESLVNFLEQMQSCEELEPEIVEIDPLLHLFPDIRDKLALKLTTECETVLQKMRQHHAKLDNIRLKMDKSYEIVEQAYYHRLSHDDVAGDDENALESLTRATATCPSFTFMLNEVKSIVESFYWEVNRQDSVFEEVSRGGEAGSVVERIEKLLPLRRESVSKIKVLSCYVQFFLKQTEA